MVTRLTERTPWRQNCGVGFMLNADVLQKILPDLKAGKKLERPKRPYLGVQGDEGALDIKGARVANISPNSPAARAGMENGDVIIAFNDQPIEDWYGLIKAVQSAKVGDTVKIKVRRDQKELVLDITLGETD
jgi:S1-C subfamily serine protease